MNKYFFWFKFETGFFSFFFIAKLCHKTPKRQSPTSTVEGISEFLELMLFYSYIF